MAGGVALALISASGAKADEAVDRCWAVKMGMSSDEVGRVLGINLGARFGWLGGGKFPCIFKIKAFGVYEIQIGDRRASPPHEAMFADELRRGIAAWGPVAWIQFSDDRLRWFAIWGDSDRDEKTLSIEPNSAEKTVTGKNSSVIHYMLQKWPIK